MTECTTQPSTHRVVLRLLDKHDLRELVRLYAEVRCGLPKGFLDPRDEEDFAQALRDGGFLIAAYCNGKLIAYNGSRPVKSENRRFREALDHVEVDWRRCFVGMGTFVRPEFRGHGLQEKLALERIRRLRERGALFQLGQVHPQNFHSLYNQLRIGSFIFNYYWDEAGFNFYLLTDLRVAPPALEGLSIEVPLQTIERHIECIEKRMIGCSMDARSPTANITYKRGA